MLESIQILDEVLASKCSEGKPTKVNIENLMSSISTVGPNLPLGYFPFE
jgi:hypothetical protein